ncbi:MAG: UMP kinase [Bacteroidales bacterium]|jgi:uridylate kinase
MKYKRILLKLSGESLTGRQSSGIDPTILHSFANSIASLHSMGVETGIVIGGGNVFRGRQGTTRGFDRYYGDQMGMLATVINALAIQSALNERKIPCKHLTAVTIESVGERFSKTRCLEALASGQVVIFSFGTGNPYFTTDTTAALRAVEMEAEVLLKGTRVDGVYSSDPEKDPGAVRYETITFSEAYEKKLKIMDLTAFTLCRENNLPVIVFNMNRPENLQDIIFGKNIGTFIKN